MSSTSHIDYLLFLFFFYCYGHHPDLHSFPTRRSSDLATARTDPPATRTALAVRSPSPTGGSSTRRVPAPRAASTTPPRPRSDRKSTRLNSSHTVISYAVFCLKKKKKNTNITHHERATQ